MTAIIIEFQTRAKRNPPNVIQVQFDFGDWTIAFFRDDRFASRLSFCSKAAAEAEAERLAAIGMEWRPDDRKGSVYIMPDDADGGCWAVCHRSQSGGSEALISRHLSLDEAIANAASHAREIGASFSENNYLNHDGGAA